MGSSNDYHKLLVWGVKNNGQAALELFTPGIYSSWEPLTAPGGPPARNKARGVMVDDILYIYGGQSADNSYDQKLYG